MTPEQDKYLQLLDAIGNTIQGARFRASTAVNTELVKANWEIGRHIVEFEQHGNERAEYGVIYYQHFQKIWVYVLEKDLAGAMYWICGGFTKLIQFGRQCLPN